VASEPPALADGLNNIVGGGAAMLEGWLRRR
jgi:hypothetical protein